MADIEDPVLRGQLDDEQVALAAVTDPNLLVLAPPGSGKTRVLVNAAAHRVRHARDLVGYEHARVMCLTFGTDASREMRQRLERPPLSVPPTRMWVGNYHALSAHLLRRYGHLIGWPRDAGLLLLPEEHRQVRGQHGEPAGVHGGSHAGGQRQRVRARHGLRQQRASACAR